MKKMANASTVLIWASTVHSVSLKQPAKFAMMVICFSMKLALIIFPQAMPMYQEMHNPVLTHALNAPTSSPTARAVGTITTTTVDA